ncbi:unnamed protein product [Vitrella brassicaformis CCMP3155]|uniref:Uncharacterized protein n=1 Tax=Vitrella brassicaformis (strain CCMP3155) TaxID=1169540 RepID=A0A0G4EDP3_VITBC|nr:unnamed protein product [Vitrella brassicaformis CCMP3155]|eukprot:CEL93512.1 unnamed protein product [Vitrella brassicaformis CCMP3155]
MCGGGGSGAAASEGRSPPRPCGPTDQPQQGPCEQQEEEEVGGERGDDCDESRGVLGGGVREGGLSLVQPRGHLYLSSPGDQRSELVVPRGTGKGQSAAEGGHTGAASAAASAAAPPPPPPSAPVDNKALIHKVHGSTPSTAVDPEAPAPAGSPPDGQPSDDTPAAASTTPPQRHGLPREHSQDDKHDRASLLGFIDDWAAEKGMDTIRQELTAKEKADIAWRDTMSTPRLRAIIEQLLAGESTGMQCTHTHTAHRTTISLEIWTFLVPYFSPITITNSSRAGCRCRAQGSREKHRGGWHRSPWKKPTGTWASNGAQHTNRAASHVDHMRLDCDPGNPSKNFGRCERPRTRTRTHAHAPHRLAHSGYVEFDDRRDFEEAWTSIHRVVRVLVGQYKGPYGLILDNIHYEATKRDVEVFLTPCRVDHMMLEADHRNPVKNLGRCLHVFQEMLGRKIRISTADEMDGSPADVGVGGSGVGGGAGGGSRGVVAGEKGQDATNGADEAAAANQVIVVYILYSDGDCLHCNAPQTNRRHLERAASIDFLIVWATDKEDDFITPLLTDEETDNPN